LFEVMRGKEIKFELLLAMCESALVTIGTSLTDVKKFARLCFELGFLPRNGKWERNWEGFLTLDLLRLLINLLRC
jgi:hypothetical protein